MQVTSCVVHGFTDHPAREGGLAEVDETPKFGQHDDALHKTPHTFT